jgi:hypothetical protein
MADKKGFARQMQKEIGLLKPPRPKDVLKIGIIEM